MKYRVRTAIARRAAVVVIAALLFALPACTRQPAPVDTTPAKQPPPLGARAANVCDFYLGKTGMVDITLGNEAIAYWRAETETTPSAAGALAAIEHMSREYANQGRAMVLRIDAQSVPPQHFPALITVLWNPTETTLTTGLIPPDKLPPHALAAFALNYGNVARVFPDGVLRVPEVTTQTLSPDSVAHRELVQNVARSTGLR